MYAGARSWYESNIRPFKHVAIDSDARVLATNVGNINYDHLWNERFLHASADRISKHIPNHEHITCEPCILGKQTRTPSKQMDDKVTDKLARVYIVHCGPVTLTTYGNGKYALNLHDEATNYTWTFVVPDKIAKTIVNVLNAWKAMVDNQTSLSSDPHRVRS